MTPKEKANQLIDRYLDIENYNNINLDLFCDECGMSLQAAKYCALIAVEEIIKERYFHNEHYKQNLKLKYHIEIELAERLEATRNYWNEVKQEIEKL